MQQLAIAAGPAFMLHALTPPDVYFTGEDPDYDWDRFLQNFQLRNTGIPLPPVLERQQFIRSLSGAAKQYLLDSPEVLNQTLPEIQQYLAREFKKRKRTTTAQLDAVVQQPNESVQKYYRRFMRVAQPALDTDTRANLTAEEQDLRREARSMALGHVLCPIFIRNLKPDLRAQVIKEQCTDIEAARRAAKQYEDYIATFGNMITNKNSSVNSINQISAQSAINKAQKTLRNLDESSRKYESRSTSPANRQDEPRACFRCGSKNHIIKHCRLKQEDRNQRSQQDRSYSRDSSESRQQHNSSCDRRSRYYDNNSRSSRNDSRNRNNNSYNDDRNNHSHHYHTNQSEQYHNHNSDHDANYNKDYYQDSSDTHQSRRDNRYSKTPERYSDFQDRNNYFRQSRNSHHKPSSFQQHEQDSSSDHSSDSSRDASPEVSKHDRSTPRD
jgi:hypothetical protein